MFDIDKIMEALPHRYPFLLVDRILEMTEEKVVGLKNVTINEPFFQGHFPCEPIMPGVLVLEAMGQVAATMILQVPEFKGKLVYLTGIEKAKFRRPVRPGDQLITEAKIERFRGKMGIAVCRSTVDGELTSEASFTFAVMDRLS